MSKPRWKRIGQNTWTRNDCESIWYDIETQLYWLGERAYVSLRQAKRAANRRARG